MLNGSNDFDKNPLNWYLNCRRDVNLTLDFMKMSVNK